MFFDGNDIDVIYTAGVVELFQKSISRGATGAAFRGEQFHKDSSRMGALRSCGRERMEVCVSERFDGQKNDQDYGQ